VINLFKQEAKMADKIKIFKYIWWINAILGIVLLVIIPENYTFQRGVIRIIITFVWIIILFSPFYPPFRKYMGASPGIPHQNSD